MANSRILLITGVTRGLGRALPYILALGPQHNGQSLTVPGF